jgi:hypothetical protein
MDAVIGGFFAALVIAVATLIGRRLDSTVPPAPDADSAPGGESELYGDF